MAARETEEKGGTTDVTSDKVETEKASKAVAEPKQGSEDGKELSKPIAAPEKPESGAETSRAPAGNKAQSYGRKSATASSKQHPSKAGKAISLTVDFYTTVKEPGAEDKEIAPPLVLKKSTSPSGRKNFFYRLMNLKLGKRKLRQVKPTPKPQKRVTIKAHTPNQPGRRQVNTNSGTPPSKSLQKEGSKEKLTKINPNQEKGGSTPDKTNSATILPPAPTPQVPPSSPSPKPASKRRFRNLRKKFRALTRKASCASVGSKRSCTLWQKLSSKSQLLAAGCRRSKSGIAEVQRPKLPLRRRIKICMRRNKRRCRERRNACATRTWNASKACRGKMKACCRDPAACLGSKLATAIISACILNIASILWIAPAIATFLEFWDPYPVYYEHRLLGKMYPKGQNFWRFQFWQVIFAVTITAGLAAFYFLATFALLLGILIDKKLLIRISLVLVGAVHVLALIVAAYQNLLLCSWHKSCWETFPGVVQPQGPCYYYFPDVARYDAVSSWSCREWPFFSHFWIEAMWWWYPFWICCSYEAFQTRRRKRLAASLSRRTSIIFAQPQSRSQGPLSVMQSTNETPNRTNQATPAQSKTIIQNDNSELRIAAPAMKPG